MSVPVKAGREWRMSTSCVKNEAGEKQSKAQSTRPGRFWSTGQWEAINEQGGIECLCLLGHHSSSRAKTVSYP